MKNNRRCHYHRNRFAGRKSNVLMNMFTAMFTNSLSLKLKLAQSQHYGRVISYSSGNICGANQSKSLQTILTIRIKRTFYVYKATTSYIFTAIGCERKNDSFYGIQTLKWSLFAPYIIYALPIFPLVCGC